MRDLGPEIEARGARVVVIGNGAPGFIAPFREATGFKGEILTDPERKAYEAAGLVRGVTSVIDPRAAVAAVRALTRGFRQGKTEGDAWQQGGVLVVRPPGEVAWRYASRYGGDHPDPKELLAALGASPAKA